MMEVLVDSSVWIDYFKGAARSAALDTLIDNNLILTNEVILTELIPFLLMKKQKALASLLQDVRCLPLHIDWPSIMELQLQSLRGGSNGIGIPDLLILQNAREHGCVLYSLDKQLLALASKLKIGTI